MGNITSITDPQGHVRLYAYDSLSRKRLIDDPNAGTLSYTYDRVGNVLTRQDALGQLIAWQYEKGNRLKAKHARSSIWQLPVVSHTFHYDAPGPDLPEATGLKGRLAWVSGPTGNTAWSYDVLGRAEVELQSFLDPDNPEAAPASYRAEYRYDPQGKVLEERLPFGMVLERGYNPRQLEQDFLATSEQGRTYAGTFLYDHRGLNIRTDLGNGLATCQFHDARGRLRTRWSVRAGELASTGSAEHRGCGSSQARLKQSISHLGYAYSPSGQIERIDDWSAPQEALPRLDATYAYDRLYQVIRAETAAGTLEYAYDTIQNLVSRSVSNPARRPPAGSLVYAEHGAGPNQVTTAFREPYSYDEVGNLRAYNGFALAPKPPPSLGELDNLVAFGTDPSSTLPPQPWQTDAVSLEQAVAAYWTGRLAGDPVEVGHYFHTDHLGGPTHVTDTEGALVGLTTWHPYGLEDARRGFQPGWTFTGAEREPERDLGLIQMGARWYAPKLGRWTRVDPLFLVEPAKAVESVLELNGYSYAANNPVSFVDPNGTTIRLAPGLTSAQQTQILTAMQRLTEDRLFIQSGEIRIARAATQATVQAGRAQGTELIRQLRWHARDVEIGVVAAGSGNTAQATNWTDASNGTGSDMRVNFDSTSNPNIPTRNPTTGRVTGANRPNQIGLGHELIHAHHGIRGVVRPLGNMANNSYQDAAGVATVQNVREEELATVGLAGYGAGPTSITENELRAEQGQNPRGAY